MSWTVEYAAEAGVVCVTAAGEIRDQDARAQTAEAICLLLKNQATGVLVDYVDALSEASLSGLYWLPEYAAELRVSWDARVAVVLPRTPYRLETYKFFELVCNNAGYNVKLFVTREAAKGWLAQTAPVREFAGHPAPA
jgi:hypothetical protein